MCWQYLQLRANYPFLSKSLSVQNVNLPIVAIRLMPPNSPSDVRLMSFLNSSPLPAVHIIALLSLSPPTNLKNYGPLLTLSFRVKLLLPFLPLLPLLFLPLPFSTSSVTRLQNSALPSFFSCFSNLSSPSSSFSSSFPLHILSCYY